MPGSLACAAPVKILFDNSHWVLFLLVLQPEEVGGHLRLVSAESECQKYLIIFSCPSTLWDVGLEGASLHSGPDKTKEGSKCGWNVCYSCPQIKHR